MTALFGSETFDPESASRLDDLEDTLARRVSRVDDDEDATTESIEPTSAAIVSDTNENAVDEYRRDETHADDCCVVQR